MSATIPAKFHGRARRDAAAFYLSQLARGVLSGEVSVASGDDRVALETPELVLLEIEIKQAKRANSVAVRLEWPRRETVVTDGGAPPSAGKRVRA